MLWLWRLKEQMHLKVLSLGSCRGVATNFRLRGTDSDCGRGDRFRWIKTSYPQIPISPRISATLSKKCKKSENFDKYAYFSKKKTIFWGDTPEISSRGGHFPDIPPPPGDDAPGSRWQLRIDRNALNISKHIFPLLTIIYYSHIIYSYTVLYIIMHE